MPSTLPTKTKKDLTSDQCQKGNVSNFNYVVGKNSSAFDNLKVVVDKTSLLDKDMKYDPISPNNWLVFLVDHLPPSAARNYIFNHKYSYPVVTPNTRLQSNAYRIVSSNRLNRFYDSYCPGVGGGTGFTVTSTLPRTAKNPVLSGKLVTRRTDFDSIWIADNDRVVKQEMTAPKGYISVRNADYFNPGFLGEGKHTVQLGCDAGKSIYWHPNKRDFFVLPAYQYFDLSAQDKKTVAEGKLPTSFNGIDGRWFVPESVNYTNIDPLYPLGPRAYKAGSGRPMLYGNDKTGFGFGFEENKYSLPLPFPNTIDSLDLVSWNRPNSLTIRQLIKSFYIGVDGTISIKKFDDYARVIPPYRKNPPGRSVDGWFNIPLYWIPTKNNPVNSVNTVVHCVTLWIKF